MVLEALPAAPPQTKTCGGCSAENEASSQFCYRCGLSLEHARPAGAQALERAGFWIRLGAYLVDSLVLFAGGFAVAIVAAMVRYNALEREELEIFATIVFYVSAMALHFIYYTVTVGWWGQTLGKRLFRLKVVRTDGSRLTYLRSFARSCAYYVSGTFFYAGFVVIGLNKEKRAAHDFMCGTMVVRVKR